MRVTGCCGRIPAALSPAAQPPAGLRRLPPRFSARCPRCRQPGNLLRGTEKEKKNNILRGRLFPFLNLGAGSSIQNTGVYQGTWETRGEFGLFGSKISPRLREKHRRTPSRPSELIFSIYSIINPGLFTFKNQALGTEKGRGLKGIMV